MMTPVYRITGWFQRRDTIIGGCALSINLDARFAEKARKFRFKNQYKFKEHIRELVGNQYALATFIEDTLFLRSMAVEGNSACLGVSNDVLDSDWSKEKIITYSGHNVDTKAQAYDLLTIFTDWVDTVEALTHEKP